METIDIAVTALVLQGGGALGSYQAGVYQGLAEDEPFITHDLHRSRPAHDVLPQIPGA